MDWRGYVVAFFALVWVANQYMSIYNRLRLDIKHEQVEIKADEQKVDEAQGCLSRSIWVQIGQRRRPSGHAGGRG